MRFVQPRTESQQAMRALHHVRESLVQDRVKTTNQMHAFLLEFGISVPRGSAVISRLSTILEDNNLPLYLSQLLLKLQQHYHYLVEQIKDLESQLKRKLDEDEVGQRLLSIPCVGTLTASTISTEIGNGKQCASSRDFAAATGLVPRQYSTGGADNIVGHQQARQQEDTNLAGSVRQSIYMNASRLQGIHCFDMMGRLQLYIRLYCSRNAASPYVIRRLTPYFHGGLQAQNTLQV